MDKLFFFCAVPTRAFWQTREYFSLQKLPLIGPQWREFWVFVISHQKNVRIFAVSLSNTLSRLEDAAPYPSRIPPGQFPPPPGQPSLGKVAVCLHCEKGGRKGRIGWGSGQREGENVSKWSDKFPLFPNPSLSLSLSLSPRLFVRFLLARTKGTLYQIPNSQLLLLYISLIVVRESELEF